MNLSGLLPITGTELTLVPRLPETLPDAVNLGEFIRSKRDDVLVAVPGVGRYRATAGIRIEIESATGVDPGQALLACITPLGALIHQRKELPLHTGDMPAGRRSGAVNRRIFGQRKIHDGGVFGAARMVADE